VQVRRVLAEYQAHLPLQKDPTGHSRPVSKSIRFRERASTRFPIR
jgi:hypothetical protein